MGAFVEIIIHAPGMWLFGPLWVQLSTTLLVLLEYGHLVPNGCICRNHHSCSWNVVIWSQMGASIKNIVPVPGIWLFGPRWVQLSKT